MLRQMGRCNLANPNLFLEVDFFVHSHPSSSTTSNAGLRQRQEIITPQGNDESATHRNLPALCRLTSSLFCDCGRGGVRCFPFRTHPALYTRSRKDRRTTLPDHCCVFCATPPAKVVLSVPKFGARVGILQSGVRARSGRFSVNWWCWGWMARRTLGGDRRQGNNRSSDQQVRSTDRIPSKASMSKKPSIPLYCWRPSLISIIVSPWGLCSSHEKWC